MDLHVVEIRYHNSATSDDETPEHAAFRAAGVYAEGGGDVRIETPTLPDEERAEDQIVNLGLICGRIADSVAAGVEGGRKVLVTGGNCAHLPGVIGGLQQALGPAARIGLVWFDAHGDFNTPRTTLSGMLGGMPVAVSAGLCYPTWRALAHQPVPLPTDRIVMVDVRNLDPDEERLIRATDVTVIRRGDSLDNAVDRLAAETDFIYLHIDLDILDARFTPTHPTKESGGPDISETLNAVDAVIRSGKVGALGLVAVFSKGEGGETTLASATDLLRGSLARWRAASAS